MNKNTALQWPVYSGNVIGSWPKEMYNAHNCMYSTKRTVRGTNFIFVMRDAADVEGFRLTFRKIHLAKNFEGPLSCLTAENKKSYSEKTQMEER